jgi:ABC-type bacteriocin/lantibiotic exporter with double-glycine peptidase domain
MIVQMGIKPTQSNHERSRKMGENATRKKALEVALGENFGKRFSILTLTYASRDIEKDKLEAQVLFDKLKSDGTPHIVVTEENTKHHHIVVDPKEEGKVLENWKCGLAKATNIRSTATRRKDIAEYLLKEKNAHIRYEACRQKAIS